MADSSQEASLGDMSVGDPTVTSMSGLKKDKLCLVCGDKALGYNFNAVSCESCKAFFRRNAHKTIRGRCEGKCDVNVESRSFCKRCRLQKCFTVGMRKDMILNEEQKKVRKQKILYNKLRRQGHLPAEDLYSASMDSMDATMTSMSDTSDDVKIKQEQVVSPGSTLSCSSLPFSGSSPSSESSTPTTTWTDAQEHIAWVVEQLSEDERNLVKELQFAMEDSSFLTTSSMSLKSLPSNPLEFVNVAEGFVRRVIKVAKNIAAFKTLHKDDQISLLKGSVVDIMMLRSAVNYDPKTETWSLNTRECLTRRVPDGCPNPTPHSTPNTPTFSASSPSFSLPSMSPPSFNYASYLTSVAATSNSSPPQARLSFHPGFGSGSPPQGFIVGSPALPVSPTMVSSSAGSQEAVANGGPGPNIQCISAEILRQGTAESRQLFMNYAKFIKSLMSSIHGDLLVLKLLVMMALFSADRSTLNEREKVQAVQETYASLLHSYTSLRFTEDRTLFARLVMKLTDLRNINEVHSKMLMSMKVDSIEPLLLEIFDL